MIPAPSNPLCTIAAPVQLSEFRGRDGVSAIAPPDMVLADFVRALLSLLDKRSYAESVVAIATRPGFECRTRDHILGAKISARAQALAIDIADITFPDGRRTAVGAAKTEQDQMFDGAARAGACGFVHTVLGPGADAFHKTHWHFYLCPGD